MMKRTLTKLQHCVLLTICSVIVSPCVCAADWKVGFGKVDITPAVPIRLSGYASRQEPFNGTSDRLSARAIVLSPAHNLASNQHKSDLVLVSLDSILVTSDFTVDISKWLANEFGIPRSQLVITSTHSHAAPHFHKGLPNLFSTPLRDAEVTAIANYLQLVKQAVQQAVKSAMGNKQDASVEFGDGEARFAVNRRLLADGKWSGFGEQVGGQVDHRVRCLRVTGQNGQLLGGTFQYACHCTTLGGSFEQVSGDWAGLAASRLESVHTGSTFLPIIGCGADSNPNPRGTYELAERHAAEIVDAVTTVLEASELKSLPATSASHFGYAALAPEQPTSQQLAERLNEPRKTNDKAWAEHMQSVKAEMGRLPESYPMPIHCWQFGDALNWVFLGGEVVVGYQYLIEKELASAATWVAAYSDDVFAYVATEGMREEGGYEVDASMTYYLQPGRWQAGTQSLILRRVREIADGAVAESEALSPSESLRAIQVPSGFHVDLVASEPLVQDPVNLSFGPDGKVWVVEMADYPLGVPGGGRVRWLKDNDGDGMLDESKIFLDGLDYPTSVQAWRDGAIVIAAPDIFFARDTTGDGRADEREILLSGIHAANPQHRASGFEISLDGWLHFGAGDGTEKIVSHRNGQTYEVEGHDVAWNPVSGAIQVTSGATQFVRTRDAFGNWFGNSNSRPIYQYAIESKFLSGRSLSGGTKRDLLTPPVAPPVYPRSQVVGRFNDLFALNRFTSACSSIVSRSPGFDSTLPDQKDSQTMTGFICEPVHNLVARIAIQPDGSTMQATRHPEDGEFDFFTSSDPWSRPVRVLNAPDGTIWIVDMVRKVIEHPEWIPTAWQDRLNVRDGAGLGRIYRVRPKQASSQASFDWQAELQNPLKALASPNGALRDLAMQVITSTPHFPQSQQAVRKLCKHPMSAVRVSAFGCLAGRNWLTAEDIIEGLHDSDTRVVRYALSHAKKFESHSGLMQAISEIPERLSSPEVDLQWLLTSATLKNDSTLKNDNLTSGLSTIARRRYEDPWCLKALSLVSDPEQALTLVQNFLEIVDSAEVPSQSQVLFEACFSRLWSQADHEQRITLARQYLGVKTENTASENTSENTASGISRSDMLLLATVDEAGEASSLANSRLQSLAQQAAERLLDENEPLSDRIRLVDILSSSLLPNSQRLEYAQQLLSTENSDALKKHVLAALGRNSTEEVPSVVLECWDNLATGLRNSACTIFLSRTPYTSRLIGALESGQVAVQDLDAATVQKLRSYHDRNLRTRILRILGQPTPRAKIVDRYLNEMSAPAATDIGKKLFKENCAACHQAGEGAQMALGPSLENLKHWTNVQWVSAILDPNQNVEPKYTQTQILTVDDQVISGIRLQSSGNEWEIGTSDGTIKKVLESDIQSSKQSTTSLMPEGLEQKFTPDEFGQLIGYLRSL